MSLVLMSIRSLHHSAFRKYLQGRPSSGPLPPQAVYIALSSGISILLLCAAFPLCSPPSGLAQKSSLTASCVLGLSRDRQRSRSKVVSCLNKPRRQGQTCLDHLLRFCYLSEVCAVGVARSGCLPQVRSAPLSWL
ncbi:hypothetical protein HJG60_008856 [Phyllostomus discolor]|uniref:Uncharacterized protein n=1 Tax=Phyllostomus discolor TaxID=89673 RepID=A0A834DFZ0_9CHIR|nr:hypothetical protein HJG60_008856 [Phyllostomus discolor]